VKIRGKAELPDQRTSDRLQFGEFTLDRADERLYGPSGPIRIGNKAFRVLQALIEQDGLLLTKEALFTSVWDGTIVSESALTSVIKELRRALGDESKSPRFIESVYGRGYRFIAGANAAAPTSAGRATPAAARHNGDSRAKEQSGEPPVVVISDFNDSAVREKHPYCAQQLREEVLSGLARFREIQLIAEDGEMPAEPVHGSKGRGYRVSASLLPDGGGVKVLARASRLGDGVVIWAETLALADGGTAHGVEQIVRRIVGSALPAMDADISLGLPEVSESFYERYLIAKRRSLAAETLDEARGAAAELETLIAERPDFGLAYPPLVRLYNTDFGFTAYGSSGAEERDRALVLAKAALAADRGNVHAYTVLGFCHLYHGEHRLARECLERALDLNPYNPVRLNEVASAMIYLGEFERAGALFEMGLHLQRFADDSLLEDRGKLHLVKGENDSARDSLAGIARHSIWSELYLALAEIALETDAGGRRFATWAERVRAGWHAAPEPSITEIEQWVAGHHPFVEPAGERLFSALSRAFGEAAVPQLSAAPVRG
jgi:DNA-binding winged helix-turn-helix (wHTH) protein